jgi:ParB/RepB/Spo0J family partition protein
MPIVVVPADEAADRLVVVDGYRRVRALRRLRRDVVQAVQWELKEADALLLRRSLSIGNGETSLEQAWLLDELRQRFGLSLQDLSRRFDRSPSWVSRRLALIRELPATIQELIREGRIVAHAAAKHLVPLARANPEQCERLAKNIAVHRLSSREVGELYAAWRDAAPSARVRLVEDPQLFLRARAELSKPREALGPRMALLEDLAAIAAISRRVLRRVREGVIGSLSAVDRGEMRCALDAAQAGLRRLAAELMETRGDNDAGPGHKERHPHAEPERVVDPADRQGAVDLARDGTAGHPLGDRGGPPDRTGGEGGAVS